ncbi:hypothetical protein C0J52_23068 [Blattella germanica]|nr:hypothetical protein C0J52_23068 [Blattella germanica]
MLVIFSAVANPTEGRRQRCRSSSTVRNLSIRSNSSSSGYKSADSYNSQPQFTLEGRPVYLQQRLKSSPPIQETPQRIRTRQKTYSCLIEQSTKEKSRECKVSSKRISGGVRRASIRRRQEQQKPSVEVVYQQKTKRKARGAVHVRQPLAMSVMSLPGKHLPRYCSCEESSQVFPTTEEAKSTLKRLLASRNHESMMSESVNTDAKQETGERGGLLEKPAYLEDTYDYLFNRHVQTLNGVIKRQEQEKLDETNEINQQKSRKQVIQLCCRDGGDNSAGEEDTSVIIGSTKCSTRQNSGGCGESTNYSDGVRKDNTNNNHPSHRGQTSCSCGEKSSLTGGLEHQCNDNRQSANSKVSNNNNSEISVNLVTSQIHELELQEIAPPKPLIIFNHVPSSSENCSVSIDSEEQVRPIISPPRSRSPTPLLEVPFPVKDLDCEMKRPPIN